MGTNSPPVRSSSNSLHPTEPLQEEIFGSGVSTPQSDVDACLICNVSDKSVSRCSGTDCPIWFHSECMHPKSGDLAADPDYCPYCWFKLVYFRTKSLRVEVIEAEKALLMYLGKAKDTTLSGDDNGDRDHSVDITYIVSDKAEKAAASSSKQEQMQVDMEEDKAVDVVGASEDAEMVPENTEDEETAEDQTNVDTGSWEKGEALPLLSTQELSLGEEQGQNDKAKGRRSIWSDSETSWNELCEQVGKMRNQETELSTEARGQRTSEEEEMLEVGVETFVAEANTYSS